MDWTIEKNDNNRIIIKFSEFKGKNYLDMRDYFKPKGKEDGPWLPTKRGMSLPIDKLAEFSTIIEKAEYTHSKGLDNEQN